MDDGPPTFSADSSCPQILRIPPLLRCFHLRDSHTLRFAFPCDSVNLKLGYAVLTPHALLHTVWPLPLSLATTRGISFDFSSSGYLDVSVPRVPRAYLCVQYALLSSSLRGFPHSEIRGSKLICSSPRLIAACHVLRRLPMPRHPPYALLRLNYLQQSFVLLPWFSLAFARIAVPYIAVLLWQNCFFYPRGKT